MSTIGIIANPASGKDIRRLVTHASVFDNLEKSHILRRVFLAMDALEVQHVFYMPDYDGLVEKALKGLNLKLKAESLHLNMWADERDILKQRAVFASAMSTVSSPWAVTGPTGRSPKAAETSRLWRFQPVRTTSFRI